MKTLKNVQFSHVLSIVLVIAIFSYFFFGKDDASTISTCKDVLLAVVFYFFGSSAGSRRKQNTIDGVIDRKGGANEIA